MFSFQQKYLPKYTSADYLQWEGNWELIGGIPYAMAPAPGWIHQKINLNIGAQIKEALKGCNQCEVNLPVNLKLSEETIVQPDVVVVCKPFEEGIFLTAIPEIIFEILSPATSEKDRTVKYDLYQAAGVKYYIIVQPQSKTAEIFKLGDNNVYHSEGTFDTGTFRFDIKGCSFDFNFETIW